jgi:hypothetical protein
MKRETTKKGAPSKRIEAERAWKKCWKDLSQERIQGWIRCIVRHIDMVILLNGDNKYKERAYKPREVLGETGEWVDVSIEEVI